MIYERTIRPDCTNGSLSNLSNGIQEVIEAAGGLAALHQTEALRKIADWLGKELPRAFDQIQAEVNPEVPRPQWETPSVPLHPPGASVPPESP